MMMSSALPPLVPPGPGAPPGDADYGQRVQVREDNEFQKL